MPPILSALQRRRILARLAFDAPRAEVRALEAALRQERSDHLALRLAVAALAREGIVHAPPPTAAQWAELQRLCRERLAEAGLPCD